MKETVAHLAVFDVSAIKYDNTFITENTLPLFLKKGIKNTSMHEIALKCGMSRKKLYTYFASKEKLVLGIVEIIVFKSEQYLSACPGTSVDAADELNNLFSYLKRTIEILTPYFFREIKKYYPNAWQLLYEFREKKLAPFLLQNFNRGIDENTYHARFNKEATCWLYFWHLQVAMEETTLNAYRRLQLINNINNCFLRGILNNSFKSL